MGIVEMSVQAGVLIAAIVLVRAITLYRLPKASFLALWGIVIARLLFPQCRGLSSAMPSLMYVSICRGRSTTCVLPRRATTW